jgi:hypothetical protein
VSRYKFNKWPGNCLGYRKFVNGHRRSVAIQIISEPEICQGAGFKLRADERVRVQRPLQICLVCRSTCLPAGKKAKSVTNNLPLLSVLCLGVYFCHYDIEKFVNIRLSFM